MTNELTTTQPAVTAGASLNEWAGRLQAAHQIGSALAATSFAPAHFRGNPEEAAVAILYGSELGMSPTTALQSLFVIGGKPAMYARPMVALVQGAGHEIWTEDKTDQSVTVCGRRRGSDKVARETWTIDRAKRAGYTNNKKYQTDPQSMLYARAASDVCRQIAADVLSGIGYSVEEMEMSGQVTSGAQQTRPQVSTATFTQQPTPEPTDAEVVEEQTPAETPKLDARRRNRMFAMFGEAGIPEDQQKPGIAHIIDRPIEHRDEITVDEYDQVIAKLQKRIDAQGGESE